MNTKSELSTSKSSANNASSIEITEISSTSIKTDCDVTAMTSDVTPIISDRPMVDSRYDMCETKKKRGFFSSFLKPAARRLHRRPLSMPSSVTAILSRNDGGALKKSSVCSEGSSVSRSKSYGDNKLARLQADKYISDGRAPLISLDCNE